MARRDEMLSELAAGAAIPGVMGVGPGKTYDAVVAAHAPELTGDAVTFFALQDGTLVVNEDIPDGSLAPVADALEQMVRRRTAPLRADGRRNLDGGRRVRGHRRAPDFEGDEVDLSVVDGERTLTVDGEPDDGSVPGARRARGRARLGRAARRAHRRRPVRRRRVPVVRRLPRRIEHMTACPSCGAENRADARSATRAALGSSRARLPRVKSERSSRCSSVISSASRPSPNRPTPRTSARGCGPTTSSCASASRRTAALSRSSSEMRSWPSSALLLRTKTTPSARCGPGSRSSSPSRSWTPPAPRSTCGSA